MFLNKTKNQARAIDRPVFSNKKYLHYPYELMHSGEYGEAMQLSNLMIISGTLLILQEQNTKYGTLQGMIINYGTQLKILLTHKARNTEENRNIVYTVETNTG